MSSSHPGTMLALRKSSPVEGYTLVSMETPSPADGEVLIKVERVAICGSDIALYKWSSIAQVIATLPFIPGHEAVGVVVAVGSNTSIPIGTRVAVENHFYCGTCYTCQEDRGDICAQMNQYGHGKGTDQGGFSQYSIVQERYCYTLQHQISSLQAVLLEPMGVAHNGVESIEVAGHDVLVVGAGPIGLLAAQVAKAEGCGRVFVADINSRRLKLASEMGADVIIDTSKENLLQRVKELTDGNGVARLVEATGAPAVVNTCFTLLRKGAKIVMIGLPHAPIHIEDPLQNFVFKALTLKTVHGRKIFHTWERCEELIASGKVDPTKIVSHEFPLDKWQEAFDCLFSGEASKIVVNIA